MLHADDHRSTAPVRFGAYLCLQLAGPARRALASFDLPALASRLELRNEFEPGGDHPAGAIAYLQRVAALPGGRTDDGIARADAVVHVAADTPEPVAAVCRALEPLLEPSALRVLTGVVRPPQFTGHAMHNFAYARRVLQQSGALMPNAFLLPMSKAAEWWSKGWLERHTYLLPRFDDAGRMLNEGHALVCEPGVACLMRRTYKQEREPAEPGAYDFLNYFECADADVPVFHSICAGLRDIQRNPEWRYVSEGPTWHGRRVAAWSALVA